MDIQLNLSKEKHLKAKSSLRIPERVLLACCVVFLGITGVATLFVTCSFPSYTEQMSADYSQLPVVLVGLLIVVILVQIFINNFSFKKSSVLKLRITLVFYAAAVGFFWAFFIAKSWPWWDSKDLINAATEMDLPDSGYFSCGGYLYRFPFQLPYLYLIKLLDCLSVSHVYYSLELVNVMFTAWAYWLIPGISDDLFEDAKITSVTTLVCFAFFPPLFNVTFAYPNAMAMTLMLFAMKLQIRSIKQNSSKLAVLAAVFAVIATLFKSTMLLGIVAIVVVWVVNLFRVRKLGNLFGLLAICICYFFASKGLCWFASIYPGMDASEGIPAYAHIYMGLTEGEEDSLNQGWYTGYVWEITGNDYSAQAYINDSIPKLKTRIHELGSNPPHALWFFSTKYISEWCEPTNESILASNWSSSGMDDVPAMSDRNLNILAKSIYYGKINSILLMIMDIMQTSILFFALLWSLKFWHRPNIFQMTLVLCAAGTALFYLFWEAKAQYTLHAYVMLIPFAAAGLVWLEANMSQMLSNYRIGKTKTGMQ